MKFFFKYYLYGLMLLSAASLTISCDSSSDNIIDNSESPSAKSYATMGEALKDVSLVDSMKVLIPKVVEKDFKDEFKEQYIVYLHQLIDHQQADKHFRQKMIVRFRGFDRPTVFVTHGYNLSNESSDGHSIAYLLNANIVELEHRNFGESMVNDPKKWDYETQYQEAADLHTVFTALKPILPGKWMSTGTSKNGETSIDYNHICPDDMDFCAAFCAPLTTSLYDVRCGKYMLQESGTEEQRKIMDAGIRRYLANGEQGLYKTFCERIAKEGLPEPSFSEFVFNVFEVYFSAFSYYNGDKRLPEMATADDSVDELYKKWREMLVANRDSALVTYYVDCSRWQGLFQNDYDVYKDLLEGTSFSPRNVNLSFVPEDLRYIYDAYDSSYQLKLVNDHIPFTSKPTLLVYAKDDPWTGARPPLINTISTKLVINPIGTHNDGLLNKEIFTPELTEEIANYVKKYIY